MVQKVLKEKKLGRNAKFKSKIVEQTDVDDIERKYVDGRLVLYQEDLEKIIGMTLDVPGYYFNHSGGGCYWNCYGNDPRVYYYYAGCITLLQKLQLLENMKEIVDKYFRKKDEVNISSGNIDTVFRVMYKQLDEDMKKRAIVYMNELLEEKKSINKKYENVYQTFLEMPE